tara:strand:+ start:8857 stop:9072 length:216 start_codon:yes stop_codon:yes gene_type:complete
MSSAKSKKIKSANQNTPSDIYIDESGFAYKIDPVKHKNSNDIIYEICPESKCLQAQSYNGLIKKYSALQSI